jgi:RDD family protein
VLGPAARLDIRCWAALADLILVAVPTIFVIAKVVPLLPSGLLPEGAIRVVGEATISMSPLAGALFIGVLSFLYLVGSWTLLGATPIQRTLGQRVFVLGSRSRIGLWQAIRGWAVLVVPLISFQLSVGAPLVGYAVLVGALIYYALLAWTASAGPEGRGFHDRIAGTIVMQVSEPSINLSSD